MTAAANRPTPATRQTPPAALAAVGALRAQLWDAGFRPVPVFNADARVGSPGKQPLGKQWEVDARLDPPFCAAAPAVPHALNTGILCDGLRVVDVDVDDPGMARQCRALAADMLGEAPTRTRAGAVRCLMVFRAAEGEPTKRSVTGRSHTTEFGCKVEALGRGQQFVAFGTHHPSGAALDWFPEAPGEITLDALPVVTEAQITAFLDACAAVIDAPAPAEAQTNGRDHTPGDPQADPLRILSALAFIPNAGPADWEAWNRIGMALWAATGGSDTGRQTWHEWSARHPAYDPAKTQDRWQHYAKSPPSSIGFGALHHAAKAHGWTDPNARPEPPPPNSEDDYGSARAKPRQATPAGNDNGDIITEGSVAEAFAEEHGDRLRYCHSAKCWHLWDGTRWKPEQTDLAFSWAHQKAKALAKDGKPAAIVSAGKRAFASGVEGLAQADRAFAVTSEVWDTDPWLLGTPGGTVDLRTGELRPPNPSDFITRLTAVAPAPRGTPHPLWTQFLDEATRANKNTTEGDKDLQRFHQRLAGYFVTGDITEEILAFLYGVGGTGKGTMIGTLSAVLNAYHVHVPIEVFTANSRINLEYYRAQMAGARLVTASETESGATWAESQIKEMTGNEAPLSARHPYGRPFTYWPQFKICIVGNHAPKLKGRSPEMERRLRIAPFKHTPDKPDKRLKRALRAEYPAILRWIIDGCLAWQKDGLGTCNAVRAETNDYFAHQDAFGRWLAECCHLVDTMSTKPSHLLTSYTAWAKDGGEASVNSTEFKELIERTPGLRYGMTKGVSLVRGVGIKAPDGYQNRGDDQ